MCARACVRQLRSSGTPSPASIALLSPATREPIAIVVVSSTPFLHRLCIDVLVRFCDPVNRSMDIEINRQVLARSAVSGAGSIHTDTVAIDLKETHHDDR